MLNVQNNAHEASDYQSNEPDSLFGICQAAGEDLHINPFFLRVGLISVLFFNPLLMIGAYLGLGLVVGVSRVLFPKPQTDVQVEVSVEQPAHFQREQELIAA
jgi:phage shock protein PspC (stress-responsive transcriptional regulator)